MITIPNRENKTVTQTNRTKVLGDLWSSFNLDIQDNLGVIKVGNRMKQHTTGTGVPVAFQFFDGFLFTAAGTGIYLNETQFDMFSAFEADASSGVPTIAAAYSDMVRFNDTLCVTSTNELYSKARNGSGTGAWTDRNASLDTNTNHKLVYFKKHNRLYITTGSTKIHSVDTSWSVATSGDYYIDVGSNTTLGSMSCMVAGSDRIWIGMRQSIDSARSPIGGCSIFEWDGISSTVTKEYKILATGIVAMTIRNDIPVAMDTNGILHEYSGYSFKEIGRLPVGRGYLGHADSTENASNIGRFMHPNGLTVTPNGTILALVCNRNTYLIGDTENVNENLPSGVWELSDNGFVHKHSLSYMPVTTQTVTDYGQNRIYRAGAISWVKFPTADASGVGSIFTGSEIYTSATATNTAIHCDAPHPINNAETDEGQKYGYFVTSWIMSENIQDTWQRCVARYRKFLDASDRIIVKYRTTEASPTEISITWVDTTSFTTATDVSALTGYEVEIIQGTGSGKCVHISSVSGSGPYTVTVDEVVTGVTTGTAKARLQAWVKSSYVSNQTSEYSMFSIGVSSVRIQIKCCMQFRGEDELFELALINKNHTSMV